MNSVFCGNCGEKNLKRSNYCTKCGSKLGGDNIDESQDSTVQDQSLAESRYEELEQHLLSLLDTSGYLVVMLANNHFVQYSREVNSFVINFDLGNRDNVPQSKLQDLVAMNFEEVEGHISKKVVVKSKEQVLDQLVLETKYIFEHIFGSPGNEPFLFDAHEAEATSSEPESSPANPISGCFGFIVIIGIIILLIGYCADTSTNNGNDAPEEIVTNSSFDASVHQVERFLKDQYLKDPDSYQGIEWSSVQVVDSEPTYRYYVRHKFRAKNSFGGYIVENKIFYLNKNGDVVDVKELGE